jgi:hypothetical protein
MQHPHEMMSMTMTMTTIYSSPLHEHLHQRRHPTRSSCLLALESLLPQPSLLLSLRSFFLVSLI